MCVSDPLLNDILRFHVSDPVSHYSTTIDDIIILSVRVREVSIFSSRGRQEKVSSLEE